MTACGKEEYTCQDGTCINKELFCNTIIDCPDASDETACSLLQIPDGYDKDVVPPHTPLHPLVLFFFINITSIRNFDLTSFTLDIDVVWRVSWNDSRISFVSLQGNQQCNVMNECDQLWKPQIAIRDGTNSLVKVTSQVNSLYITRYSLPLADEDDRVDESK